MSRNSQSKFISRKAFVRQPGIRAASSALSASAFAFLLEADDAEYQNTC
jgi:hypothetical protein